MNALQVYLDRHSRISTKYPAAENLHITVGDAQIPVESISYSVIRNPVSVDGALVPGTRSITGTLRASEQYSSELESLVRREHDYPPTSIHIYDSSRNEYIIDDVELLEVSMTDTDVTSAFLARSAPRSIPARAT